MTRRMFSDEITGTDAFLDMPVSSQLLYFQLGMSADDDGFVSSPKMVMRVTGASPDDFKLLIAKKFLLQFQSGVCVVKHWRINNQIRKDIYKETKYLPEKNQLYIRENGAYSFNSENAVLLPKGHFTISGLDYVNATSTPRHPSIGKDRKGKVISDEQSSSTNKVSFEPKDLETSSYLLEKIKTNIPTFKEPNVETWAEHIRLMRERDNRTYEQIKFVIDWSQQDNFWSANILSTKKLREKFDTLVAQIKRNADKNKIKKSNVIL